MLTLDTAELSAVSFLLWAWVTAEKELPYLPMGEARSIPERRSISGDLQQSCTINWRCSTISESLVNGQVRFREVRLIGTEGEQLGIMSSLDALKIAEEAELDLVCISPTAKPPVCKIIDYGKYRYEMIRRDKEAKKKQKIVELKEVRLSPNIDTNDLATKTNAARKFLEKGNKVKVTLRFRGREMSHMNQSRYILDDFAKELADIAVIDKPSKVEGRTLVMFMSAKKN
ncbi:translation initiation factor IF-3 [Moryella indoligenes]|uniref:Translation initiation factor IF-3 n=1 Tax=Moryella indoligenes TaxID=371674 RepID=A0AAE3VCV5_9FIRM|nr:translation initiation factor IF-3 [Moryella indoligenes]